MTILSSTKFFALSRYSFFPTFAQLSTFFAPPRTWLFTAWVTPDGEKKQVTSWLCLVATVISPTPHATTFSASGATNLDSMLPVALSISPIWLRKDTYCNLFLVKETERTSPTLLRCQSLTPASDGLSATAATASITANSTIFMLKDYNFTSGKPNYPDLNIIFIHMRSINKYTLDVRREGFLKAIRQQQRQQIKNEKRALLLKEENYERELWRFRVSMLTMDLAYEQHQVLKFLDFVEEQAHSEQFCRELRGHLIMEELVELVGRSLRGSKWQYPCLVGKLMQEIYRLLARCNSFFSIIEHKFPTILYLFYRYPTPANLEKVCQFLTGADSLISNQAWRQGYDKLRLVSSNEIIERLLSEYILGQSYTMYMGEAQATVTKRQPRWFRNAIKCLQAVYSLLQLDQERNETWKTSIVMEGLFQGLNVFISESEKEFCLQNYDQETDSDSFCDFNGQKKMESEQTNLYFISLILDILLLRQTLLQERGLALLQSTLVILLRELQRCSFVSLTAIKIIKILYEQVIIDDEELQMLSDAHPPLSALITALLNSDFV